MAPSDGDSSAHAPHPTVTEILAAIRARGVEVPPGLVSVGEMGDSAELARKLIGLVRSGRKRATAALAWSYEHDGERPPERGQVEIVVDHTWEPALLVRYTSVDVVPFRDVTAEYAAMEGEGDLSLEHWRRGHWAFFSRECARIGREPAEDMPVVCGVFEVIADVPPAGADA